MEGEAEIEDEAYECPLIEDEAYECPAINVGFELFVSTEEKEFPIVSETPSLEGFCRRL